MIDDLDRTIEVLLRRSLPAPMAEQIQISFAAPDDQFPARLVTPPAIDLFLFDIRENLELRNSDVFPERTDDGYVNISSAPVRVDLSYLITAWASDSALPDPAQDEHRLLGEVMRVLLRYKTIPSDMLQGALAGAELPLPVSALQQSRLQSPGEFWQALGGKPRTALNYVVTLPIDVNPVERVPVVTEKVLDVHTRARKPR